VVRGNGEGGWELVLIFAITLEFDYFKYKIVYVCTCVVHL
jgi:hypothetical protein